MLKFSDSTNTHNFIVIVILHGEAKNSIRYKGMKVGEKHGLMQKTNKYGMEKCMHPSTGLLVKKKNLNNYLAMN